MIKEKTNKRNGHHHKNRQNNNAVPFYTDLLDIKKFCKKEKIKTVENNGKEILVKWSKFSVSEIDFAKPLSAIGI